MIEKNDIICAVTDAIGSNGEGIIRHEGVTFFVPACLPGEKVIVKVLKVKGNIGYGKAEEILTPAEERVRPKCPVFSKCGGCCLQHLDYPAQLIHKATVVKDARVSPYDDKWEGCFAENRGLAYRRACGNQE